MSVADPNFGRGGAPPKSWRPWDHPEGKAEPRHFASDSARQVDEKLDALQEVLARKIIERTVRPMDQYRKAYQLFGQPTGGITYEKFALKLMQLGITTHESDLRRLFDRLDGNGNGIVSFQEMVAAIIPGDYGFNRWKSVKDIKGESDYFVNRAVPMMGRESNIKRRHMRDRLPSALDTTKKDSAYFVHKISQKIMERVKSAQRTHWEAYCMLVGGNRDTPFGLDQFKFRMQQFGLEVPDRITEEIFAMFDTDGSGDIDVHEVVEHILPDEGASALMLRSEFEAERAASRQAKARAAAAAAAAGGAAVGSRAGSNTGSRGGSRPGTASGTRRSRSGAPAAAMAGTPPRQRPASASAVPARRPTPLPAPEEDDDEYTPYPKGAAWERELGLPPSRPGSSGEDAADRIPPADEGKPQLSVTGSPARARPRSAAPVPSSRQRLADDSWDAAGVVPVTPVRAVSSLRARRPGSASPVVARRVASPSSAVGAGAGAGAGAGVGAGASGEVPRPSTASRPGTARQALSMGVVGAVARGEAAVGSQATRPGGAAAPPRRAAGGAGGLARRRGNSARGIGPQVRSLAAQTSPAMGAHVRREAQLAQTRARVDKTRARAEEYYKKLLADERNSPLPPKQLVRSGVVLGVRPRSAEPGEFGWQKHAQPHASPLSRTMWK